MQTKYCNRKLSLMYNNLRMSRLSDEWCCMNCVHQEECMENDPNMNLLGYCLGYEDVEGTD